jgi:hypothetical protein
MHIAGYISAGMILMFALFKAVEVASEHNEDVRKAVSCHNRQLDAVKSFPGGLVLCIEAK